MKEIILIKNGEIALKGLNRGTFEDILIKNIKRRIKSLGEFSYLKSQSTIYITPKSDDINVDLVVQRLSKVFGIAAISKACVVAKDMELIKEKVVEYTKDIMPYAKTFKAFAKRADKHFPLTSPEIAVEVGGSLLSAYSHLKVDVKNPEVSLTVEVRETSAYIHAEVIKGAGGMPVGSSGKGMLLISGGIDSPVAGYMMAKRGLETFAIHFISPPYTSDRALRKVEDLCQILCDYTGQITFFCVPFTKMQEAIKKNCPDELFTIIMRRFMMVIAQRFAEKYDIKALITGESLAQVASQTIQAIGTTDAVCEIPIFRPLIGMDKIDIIEISKKINTFETSILPYEDCCTVFTPKRPKTRPVLQEVIKAEQKFDFEQLLNQAIDNTEIKFFRGEF